MLPKCTWEVKGWGEPSLNSLLSYEPCCGATEGRGIFLICSKALPRLEVALLSQKRGAGESQWNGECVVPRVTQEEVQGAVGYPVWNLAGGNGWMKGVVVIGFWSGG